MPPEPSALVGVLVAAYLYGRGTLSLWRRAGRDHGVRRWHVVSFYGGLLALLVALESPLDALSTQLFAAHMVQHLLLIVVAGPLLVLGTPLVPMLWALPRASRRTLGGWWLRLAVLGQPALTFGLHSVVLWLWHVPTFYEAAIANRGIHVLEHLSFVVTAALFWWAVVVSGRAAHGLGVLYLFGMALQSTLLGALLAFSPTPWYTAHLASAPAWGLSPLDDQQLAGLIMWVPGGSVYLAGALGLIAAWSRKSPRWAA